VTRMPLRASPSAVRNPTGPAPAAIALPFIAAAYFASASYSANASLARRKLSTATGMPA
jgi:hypothetical protein